MQVGATKDQGLYNKPSAAVHPGALAAGTLPQYNTILRIFVFSSSCSHPLFIVVRGSTLGMGANRVYVV